MEDKCETVAAREHSDLVRLGSAELLGAADDLLQAFQSGSGLRWHSRARHVHKKDMSEIELPGLWLSDRCHAPVSHKSAVACAGERSGIARRNSRSVLNSSRSTCESGSQAGIRSLIRQADADRIMPHSRRRPK